MYQGQYYDAEIELAYNRYRYYDPEDGNYISKDPIGSHSGEGNFYSYVEDPNIWTDVLGLSKYYGMLKDGSRKKRKPGPKKKRGRKKKKSKHGNSKDYDGTTYLYKRYDKDGNFQKHGIANDPNTRYSKAELDGGRLDIEDSGTRGDMLDKERHLVETEPGPLNNEPWAGSKS